MTLKFTNEYETLTDRQLVERIVAKPHDDNAAAFLLCVRYRPKLRMLCKDIFDNLYWYDDCISDLFDYLKGRDRDWHKLGTFEWRCRFATWIGKTARNRFLEIKPYLIGNAKNSISIDDDTTRQPPQLPDNGAADYEQRQLKVLVMEAVGMLADPTQRFVILKTLHGYNSRETALLLEKKWHKEGIEKHDNKGNRVTPSAAYVDLQRQRAKAELKKIIAKLL